MSNFDERFILDSLIWSPSWQGSSRHPRLLAGTTVKGVDARHKAGMTPNMWHVHYFFAYDAPMPARTSASEHLHADHGRLQPPPGQPYRAVPAAFAVAWRRFPGWCYHLCPSRIAAQLRQASRQFRRLDGSDDRGI